MKVTTATVPAFTISELTREELSSIRDGIATLINTMTHPRNASRDYEALRKLRAMRNQFNKILDSQLLEEEDEDEEEEDPDYPLRVRDDL